MSDFSIDNIPFGIYSQGKGKKTLASRYGDQLIDLYAVADAGLFSHLKMRKSVFRNDYLNDFISLGKKRTNGVRTTLQQLIRDNQLPAKALVPAAKVDMHLPVRVGDYTDFYSSEQHAFNVGCMFRDPANALMPNWKHLPVGYHGRASSIVVSGTNFKRPKGQTRPNDAEPPVFGPSKLVDIELEMATIVGKNNPLGEPVPINKAEDHIFGFLLLNDWSARDIQKWEYVPLGPFLAKNFCTSVSPWVVTIEALAPFRVPAEKQVPPVLPYLKEKKHQHFDIQLEVTLITAEGQSKVISRSNFKHMYWTVGQQIAHHTVNGCNLQIGDVLGSGTISGPTPDSYGSLLELTWQGKNPIELPDGSVRRFLQDGDTIVIKGFAEKDGVRVGFGEVRNTLLAAN